MTVSDLEGLPDSWIGLSRNKQIPFVTNHNRPGFHGANGVTCKMFPNNNHAAKGLGGPSFFPPAESCGVDRQEKAIRGGFGAAFGEGSGGL